MQLQLIRGTLVSLRWVEWMSTLVSMIFAAIAPGVGLIGTDHAGITGLAFSDQSELLASYSDEFIYLFTRYGARPNSVFC